MNQPRASCGLTFNCPADLSAVAAVAAACSYDFICAPIVNPRYRFPGSAFQLQDEKPVERNYPHTRPDLVLRSNEWMSTVVGILTRSLNVESDDDDVRKAAVDQLSWELSYATHLGLSAVMINLIKANNPNLARLLRSYLAKLHGPQVWLKVEVKSDSWHWWNMVRCLDDFDKRLGVALVLTSGADADSVDVRRWLGEPIKVLVVPTRLFLKNKKGFPVLPRSLQAVVKLFIEQNVQFVIEGSNGDTNVRQFGQYLNHLVQQHVPVDPVKQFAHGFEDYLQNPLQPLMDNLESTTYEVFEKDPVKYAEYENAIRKALLDRVSEEDAATKTIVLMVLGAGRGPIVKAALRAADAAGRRVKLFAVEKNPYAVITLLNLKEEEWKDKVEVISSDMRKWKPKEDQLADIIISELLGSFADNELSPECLYSAQHLMKPDGISIPQSYTSWVGPLQSSKLYQEVRASADPEKNPEAHFETPYVVHFQNRFEIAKPQPLFTFVHPIRDAPIKYDRYGVLNFKVDDDCVLNGFAGYFECVLYRDVVISTNPDTHSKGMFSWFPLFFPLRYPVQCSRGSEVELHFWRINNSKTVWYEWTIAKPVPMSIHNPNGRSYTIGL